jgi:hypothetical protein
MKITDGKPIGAKFSDWFKFSFIEELIYYVDVGK